MFFRIPTALNKQSKKRVSELHRKKIRERESTEESAKEMASKSANSKFQMRVLNVSFVRAFFLFSLCFFDSMIGHDKGLFGPLLS